MLEKVLCHIRERGLMRAGDRVAVAVSGGADSVALVRVLLELRPELGIVLFVAHFNHQLRGAAADADEAFVADLARRYGLQFFSGRGDVREHAAINKLGVEAAARELRLAFFAELGTEKSLQSVATAHTLDDQAETVLLKFLRGAGTRGLAGIYPVLAALPGARIVRPLLTISRAEVEAYLESLGQDWREDESNRDPAFMRNRIRHELLPLLTRSYNPNLRQVLSDSAELTRAEEDYWQTLVERELSPRMTNSDKLAVSGLDSLPVALQRRLLKRFADLHDITVDFEHIEKLRQCATGGLPRTKLPGGWTVQRKDDYLWLQDPGSQSPPVVDYQYALPIPGEVHIAELGIEVRATLLNEEDAARESESGCLLMAGLLGAELNLRNWRPGDRFQPVHRGSEEKLKRLFSEQHIPAEQRPGWPVALQQQEIVWVRAMSVAAALAWDGRGAAVKIEVHKAGCLRVPESNPN